MLFCSVLTIKRHSGFEVMPKKLTEMRYSSAGYYSAENKRVFVFSGLVVLCLGSGGGKGVAHDSKKLPHP